MARHKSKILFYFLIGIALPCLLLSYFAFRGIQNDRALYEQQMLHDNQAMAQRVVETIHHQFDVIEQDYHKLIISFAEAPDTTSIAALHHFKAKHHSIETIFTIQFAPDHVELPIAVFFFSNQARRLAHHFQNLSPAMAAGQQNEFQEHSYPAAIQNYQAALNQTSNRNERAEIFAAIARAQKKAARWHDARQSYQNLLQNFANQCSPSGVPFGLAAPHALGSLSIIVRDTLTAIQAYLSAYNDLSQRRWSLDESQYRFWRRSLQDSLQKIFAKVNLLPPFSSYLNKFQTIQEQVDQQERMTSRLLKFQAEAGHAIARKFTLRQNGERLQGIVSLGDQKYFISLYDAAIMNKQTYWGIIWSAEAITESLRNVLINQSQLQSQITWQVIDAEHHVLLESKNPMIDDATLLARTTFVNNFPDMTLEFYHLNPTLIESLLASRRSVYFYIFLLIAGILAFGLILTNRSVAHELELARLKSDFVSSVSHELKSPLTSIRQLTEMLQTGRVPSEQRRQKYYDVIVEQSKRLALMISNVLDFARLEEGKKQFNFELTEMDHFLKEIVAAIQQQVGHDGFEIKFITEPSLPPILIDRSAIAQAVNNLVDNAIKYSDQVKKVIVNATVQDKFCCISVQDFGIGIKPEDLNNIFDRFHRGDDELVKARRGSGLGLTLVKQIIAAHHGRIEVVGEPGKGSTFTIKLPI